MVFVAVAVVLWSGPGLRQVALVCSLFGLWDNVCPWVWQYPLCFGGARLSMAAGAPAVVDVVVLLGRAACN